MKSFAERAIEFYSGLQIRADLPPQIEVLNPYSEPVVRSIVEKYFLRFYRDNQERVIILGINPGRFGAGITGITFTDPVRLEEECGISNSFKKRSELSSRFIYDVIKAFGGVEKFFIWFYLSAVSPLGFVRSGKNLNYYDEKELEEALEEFILSTLHAQINLGIRMDKAICLGEGKNFNYLKMLNRKTGLFGEIFPLPHPRWVMQYRFRRKEEFVRAYLEVLQRI
jgi:hypothetical protein